MSIYVRNKCIVIFTNWTSTSVLLFRLLLNASSSSKVVSGSGGSRFVTDFSSVKEAYFLCVYQKNVQKLVKKNLPNVAEVELTLFGVRFAARIICKHSPTCSFKTINIVSMLWIQVDNFSVIKAHNKLEQK